VALVESGAFRLQWASTAGVPKQGTGLAALLDGAAMTHGQVNMASAYHASTPNLPDREQPVMSWDRLTDCRVKRMGPCS
jgi:hypothetical protein